MYSCAMTYLTKPKLHHPTLPKNKVGFTRRDYEGKVSTLCAGCGHDSISAALIQAFFELDILPHKVAKLSGIGCSSKTPDYFLGNSHGFNTVHGRMPSVLTGANLANRDLLYPVSYTHLRAHETGRNLVCRLLLEKKKKKKMIQEEKKQKL